MRGPAVFAGLLGATRRDRRRASYGGWFCTGDLGVVEDGYVRLLGRSTEVIISGGFNVYPAEVEDVLLGHPSVAEVAVTGTPSEEWGEVVTAWVVPDGVSRPDVEGLLTYAAAASRPVQAPASSCRSSTRLPRNSMGKVLRSELRSSGA